MRKKPLIVSLGVAGAFGTLFYLVFGLVFGIFGGVLGLVVPYFMAGPQGGTNGDNKGLKLTSHMLHPMGRMFLQKITSHRAFQWGLGLYEVDHIFTLPDGSRMMLHSAGNPAPYGGAKGESIKIGEKTFISGLLQVLSTLSGKIKKPFSIPQWLMALLVMGFVLLIILVTKK